MKVEIATSAHIDEMYDIEMKCHSHPMTKKNLASNFTPQYINAVALDNEHVHGFYIANEVAGEITLFDIVVDPAMQGRGLGAQLLRHLIDSARARQCQCIWLEVRTSNVAAIGLYRKMGFIDIDIRKNYYPSHSGREDALIMQLETHLHI